MIAYVKGDAAKPWLTLGEGRFVIAHIVNNACVWGAGFVMALSKEDIYPEKCYRSIGWPRHRLGTVQTCTYKGKHLVANMVAQDGVNDTRHVPKRALIECLDTVAGMPYFQPTMADPFRLVMPRIGTGLGRGKWEDIEPLIDAATKKYNIDATVFDFG